MLYVWADYKDGHGYVPHMSFECEDRDDADFEIEDLKDHGHRAKYGKKFPPIHRDGEIIAECKMPKQRMTRQFGCILRYNEDQRSGQKKPDITYSVHTKYYEDGSLANGHYQLDFENGIRVFQECVNQMFSYPASVYEIADKKGV